MGKRLAIYLGLLGATLALGGLGSVKLGASLSGWPDGGWLWREVTGEPNAAIGPRTGNKWMHFGWTTFVNTQGNFVSAGQVYVALEPWQAERQQIVLKTYVGLLYKITVPGWQNILQVSKGPALAVDIHVLRWVDVWHTGVDGQR